MPPSLPDELPPDLPKVQWYPGHIAKAQKTLAERLALVDAVIEVADARIPDSSRFREARRYVGQKPHLLVYTKADLADPLLTRAWAAYHKALLVDGRSGKGLPALKQRLAKEKAAIDARMARRGRLPRPLRVMVLGLPNVGKSSLINRLAGARKAQVGDKPGVTRAPGWIKLGRDLELLDTPGLVPPRLDDAGIAFRLALVGAIPLEAMDPLEVAKAAVHWLPRKCPAAHAAAGHPADLEALALARGWRGPGGPDMERAGRAFLNELREGAYGQISWDGDPPQARPPRSSATPQDEVPAASPPLADM
ncbi:MAG: ribosome biogenesis GTPase YlqF [Candidatus Sericytochromatia bacterium]|nr:ribosome biogenesis GTPase YlqF [Candidatus Sericytochromatia bacterium]